MAADHSFTSYVAKRFDNNFWAVAEQYLNDNAHSLCSDLHRIHRAREMENSDVKVEHIWGNDLPGMKIQFDVALSIVINSVHRRLQNEANLSGYNDYPYLSKQKTQYR